MAAMNTTLPFRSAAKRRAWNPYSQTGLWIPVPALSSRPGSPHCRGLPQSFDHRSAQQHLLRTLRIGGKPAHMCHDLLALFRIPELHADAVLVRLCEDFGHRHRPALAGVEIEQVVALALEDTR